MAHSAPCGCSLHRRASPRSFQPVLVSPVRESNLREIAIYSGRVVAKVRSTLTGLYKHTYSFRVKVCFKHIRREPEHTLPSTKHLKLKFRV